jgi:hypothetical protein
MWPQIGFYCHYEFPNEAKIQAGEQQSKRASKRVLFDTGFVHAPHLTGKNETSSENRQTSVAGHVYSCALVLFWGGLAGIKTGPF